MRGWEWRDGIEEWYQDKDYEEVRLMGPCVMGQARLREHGGTMIEAAGPVCVAPQ